MSRSLVLLFLAPFLAAACAESTAAPDDTGVMGGDATPDDDAATAMSAAGDGGSAPSPNDAGSGTQAKPDGWRPMPAPAGPGEDHGQSCNGVPEPTTCAFLEVSSAPLSAPSMRPLKMHEKPRAGTYTLQRITLYAGGGDAGLPASDAGAEPLGRCESMVFKETSTQQVLYWDGLATERYNTTMMWPHGAFQMYGTCGPVYGSPRFAGLPLLGAIFDSAFVDDDGFLLRGARNAFDFSSPEPTTPVYEMYYRRVGD